MRKKKGIPFRNRNQYGWWVAQYIERFEYFDEDKKNLNRRCQAWENTILIRAKNREEAYKKAIKIGRLGDGNEAENSRTGRKGAWRFEGLTELLPVYEKIEDGAEIMWAEHNDRTVKKIQSWVKTKKQLDLFNDKDL